MTSLAPAARDLILEFECGGKPGYSPRPEWPGGESGITIGIGYDIGYADREQFCDDWEDRVRDADLVTLGAMCGVTGSRAGVSARGLGYMHIPWESAVWVFDMRSMPLTIAQTERAFPGAAALPPESFGALVSLVYNRGGGMVGDRRSEMRTIRDYLRKPSDTWRGVVAEIADMTRLWGHPTASNLSGRRLREAALFAGGLRGAGLYDADALLYGDRGTTVELLQRELRRLGSSLRVDGAFGPATMLAVWRRQAAIGVPRTGVADRPLFA